MTTDSNELTERIAQLKAQQQQVLAEANRQMGLLDGQIAILEEWRASLIAERMATPNGAAEVVHEQ